MDVLVQVGLANAVAAAILALLAAVVSRCCRRPAVTHALWLLVLLKLITPPLWHVPIEIPRPDDVIAVEAKETIPLVEAADTAPMISEPLFAMDQVVGVDPADGEAEDAALGLLPVVMPAEVPQAREEDAPVRKAASAPLVWSWQKTFASAWIAGSVFWLALTVGRVVRFGRLLRHATPAPAPLQKQARRLAEAMELERCPGVWLLPGRLTPMLWGLVGPPRLLLPAELLQRLSEQERATLLVHELAHFRRGDHWLRGFELLITALYWWHPVVWWARRELQEAEEQCCDAWVVSTLPGTARVYATALVSAVDFLSELRPTLPPLASGIGHVHDLRRRLKMIMLGTAPRALTWTGFLAVLGIGAMLLPLLPTWAQAPRSEPPQEEQEQGDQKEQEKQQLQAEMQRAQAEMESARQRMEQVRRRMQELEGRDGGRGRAAERGPARPRQAERLEITIKDAEGNLHHFYVPQGGGPQAGAGLPVVPPGMSRAAERGAAGGMMAPVPGPPRPSTPGTAPAAPMGPVPPSPARTPRGAAGPMTGAGFSGGTGFAGGFGSGPAMGGGGKGGMMGAMGAMGAMGGGSPDADRRLASLEQKLETLLRDLAELRNELRQRNARPGGATPPGSPPGGGGGRPGLAPGAGFPGGPGSGGFPGQLEPPPGAEGGSATPPPNRRPGRATPPGSPDEKQAPPEAAKNERGR